MRHIIMLTINVVNILLLIMFECVFAKNLSLKQIILLFRAMPIRPCRTRTCPATTAPP